jgi:hypothetical protein
MSKTRGFRSVWFRGLIVGYLAGYLSCFWVSLYTTTSACSKDGGPPLLLRVPPPPPPPSLQLVRATTKPKAEDVKEHSLITLGGAKDELNKNQSRIQKRFQWYKKYVNNMSRPFEPYQGSNNNNNNNNNSTSYYDWCIPETKPTPIQLQSGQSAVGLLYIKSSKASSSTLEGVALSIAHNVARRQFHNSSRSNNSSNDPHHYPHVCTHYNRHEFADNRHHARRAMPSLLWSFVRDPSQRDLSHYFHFEVGRNGKETTDKKIINSIEYEIKGRQVRTLVRSRGKAPMWPKHELHKDPDEVMRIIQHSIIDWYDFLGVVERMDESLACLTLLWKLPATDVIVLSAKRSGGYDDAGGGGDNNKTCVKIPNKFITPAVQEYLNTKHILFNADILLYHAVNRSLDLTIKSLGHARVAERVQEIRYLQHLAEEHCRKEAYFPCSETGELQLELAANNCHVQDAACGYECVDKLMKAVTTKGVRRRHANQH